MGCLAGLFLDRTMAFCGQHRRVGLPEVRAADAPFPVIRRKRRPEFPTRRRGTIPKGETDDATGLSLQNEPNPDDIPFVTDERPQFIKLENGALSQRRDSLANRQD